LDRNLGRAGNAAKFIIKRPLLLDPKRNNLRRVLGRN